MRKPANLTFGVDEKPPIAVIALVGAQHFAMMIYSALPLVIVARAAGASPEVAVSMISIGLIISAISTLAFAFRLGGWGCGYLLPSGFYISFVGPYVAAAKLGGLPFVFGMTILIGVVEALFAPFLYRLRAYLPSEIAGLVVFLTGVLVVGLGLDIVAVKQIGMPVHQAVSAITLLSIIAFNVWTRGLTRLLAVLMGMIVGYIVSLFLLPELPQINVADPKHEFLQIPQLDHIGWAFDWGNLPLILVLGLSAVLTMSGNITMQQRLNDADWVRPEMSSVSNGIFMSGLLKMLSGFAGTTAIGSMPSMVGVTIASGVASRYVAISYGLLCLILAFLPQFSAILVAAPEAVLAGPMLFVGSALMVNGLQIVVSRMLDARRTAIVGLSISAALAAIAHPEAYQTLPAWLSPFFSSALVAGTSTGLLLVMLFRIGIRRREELTIAHGKDYSRLAHNFMMKNGGTWGARHDVIQRAAFGAEQLIETIRENYEPQGDIQVRAQFDEFNLDLTATYDGLPMVLPDTRPTNEVILNDANSDRLLAAYLMQRNADKVDVKSTANGSTVVGFHFDH